MKDTQTLLIQITVGELNQLIQQNVNEAVRNVTKLPEYVTADVLSKHFQVTHDKFITPTTLKKWPILQPAKRIYGNKVFFHAEKAFEAFERLAKHEITNKISRIQ